MGNLYCVTSYEESAGAFRASWEAGIRYFDTAPLYGFNRSERRLGTMLTDLPRDSYTLQAAALQFPFAHPAALTVVSGARNAGQINANIAWFEEPIPPSFWTRLKERGLIAGGAPVPA